AGRPPHNATRFASCQGFGTCGTCAVQIEGEVEPKTPSTVEAWRLGFPPHDPKRGLRLACQVKPRSDLQVTKHPGYWGQETP
ncbi:MAG: ferredoxin, partial [Polyangiales bacterium]